MTLVLLAALFALFAITPAWHAAGVSACAPEHVCGEAESAPVPSDRDNEPIHDTHDADRCPYCRAAITPVLVSQSLSLDVRHSLAISTVGHPHDLLLPAPPRLQPGARAPPA